MGSAARHRRHRRAALPLAPTGRPSPGPAALAELVAPLSGADQIEVAGLLNGSGSFRRSFRPARPIEGVAEVVVWAEGEAVGIELIPGPGRA